MHARMQVAVYSFDAVEEAELSMREGDELVVLRGEEDGWVPVRRVKDGAEGIVPASYMRTL